VVRQKSMDAVRMLMIQVARAMYRCNETDFRENKQGFLFLTHTHARARAHTHTRTHIHIYIYIYIYLNVHVGLSQ
jgi:hypothetical protein